MTRQELLAIAKPILFNTEMVGAILDNRKTVTRRVVKPKNAKSELVIDIGALMNRECITRGINKFTSPKPPYQPGDVLYVREAWNLVYVWPRRYLYKTHCPEAESMLEALRWRPSIHMPKEAARLFLRVTDVRVERLQDITEADIQSEGIIVRPAQNDFETFIAPKIFETVWNSTIKKSDLPLYGWESPHYGIVCASGCGHKTGCTQCR